MKIDAVNAEAKMPVLKMRMTVNYHTHSYHCRHAGGKPEEYVLAAIENGLEELGFSDHVPYPFSNGHRSGFRMDVEETETYVNEILELREKYKGQIKILIGYEAEYYPVEFEAMMKNITRFPLDYLICGQHFTRNEYDGKYCGVPSDDIDQLAGYVDQLTAAMASGAYTYICHPDMYNFTGDDNAYTEQVIRLCEASAKYDVPLEYNCLGMEGKRHYPADRFWKTVATTSAKVAVGSDAHQPDRAGNQESFARALANLAGFGITPLDRPVIKKPVF